MSQEPDPSKWKILRRRCGRVEGALVAEGNPANRPVLHLTDREDGLSRRYAFQLLTFLRVCPFPHKRAQFEQRVDVVPPVSAESKRSLGRV